MYQVVLKIGLIFVFACIPFATIDANSLSSVLKNKKTCAFSPTLICAKSRQSLFCQDAHHREVMNRLKQMRGQELYDIFPWAFTYYYGLTVTDPLARIFNLTNLNRWPEHILSVEVAHTLDKNNFLRHFLSPIVGVVQFALNFTFRQGTKEPTIYEIDPYLAFRWANFSWNQFLNTSFAIGEGVSYTSSVPSIEKKYNTNTKRLLNYLMFEATFALPKHPQLQFIMRIHHRSGAYGLYHAGNSGSNDLGLGLRILFT